ncbi:MAG: hypothetical protein AAGL29_06090 [Bacteroidota bacterium]
MIRCEDLSHQQYQIPNQNDLENQKTHPYVPFEPIHRDEGKCNVSCV